MEKRGRRKGSKVRILGRVKNERMGNRKRNERGVRKEK